MAAGLLMRIAVVVLARRPLADTIHNSQAKGILATAHSRETNHFRSTMHVDVQMLKQWLIHAGAFLLGTLAMVVPMFVWASIIHAEETARHEQTMSPGITMFLGLLMAPFTGLLAVVIVHFVRRGR